ncbi:MAG: hypothetical protein Q8O62_02935 [Aequorivita sp.]|nr:hypothetical protein [Aequorivita sp.]
MLLSVFWVLTFSISASMFVSIPTLSVMQKVLDANNKRQQPDNCPYKSKNGAVQYTA